jgi:hypothetical protein
MKKAGFILSVLFLFLAGCGDVQWFPVYVRQATTANTFSFPVKTSVPFNAAGTLTDTSASITVAGLTADSSPITVTTLNTGVTNTLMINGTAASSTTSTVKNGDVVTVLHTTGSTPTNSVTSTVTIGGVNPTPFTSVTQNVETFAATGTANLAKGFSLIVASGEFTISVSTGSFSVNGGGFLTGTQSVSFINGGTTLTLLNPVASVMTVTIDGVASTFTTALP